MNRERAATNPRMNRRTFLSYSARAAAGADGESTPRSFRAPLDIDLASIDVPVIASNGEFDCPYGNSHRMRRELKNLTNVILPGKNYMTAIAVGVPMDET